MKRLQFDFPDERVKELDALVERTGLKTRAQLINSALTLFEWAVREREAGRIIASVDEITEKYKEVEMPGFPKPEKYILSEAEQALLKKLFSTAAVTALESSERSSSEELSKLNLSDALLELQSKLASLKLVSLQEEEKARRSPPRRAKKSGAEQVSS